MKDQAIKVSTIVVTVVMLAAVAGYLVKDKLKKKFEIFK